MPRSVPRAAIAVLPLCLAASAGSAQLVVGTTSTNTSNGAAFYIDLNALTATRLWNSQAQKKVNGLAADTVNGKLYSNDAARLNTWDYGSVGTPPTLIGGMFRTTDNVAYSPTGVDGLAFANGKLYGVTSFASTTFRRGIYELPTTANADGRVVMNPVWTDPSGSVAFGGLEYNNANGLFYATQSQTTGTWTPGIWTIDAFGSGAATKLVDFPAGQTRIDGLALGNGFLWMTVQLPATSEIAIYQYNLSTNAYEPGYFSLPFADGTNRASGACWAPGANVMIPAPGAAALLGIAGLGARRRRR